MKTILAATLVLFSLSTAAPAFELPNMDGVDVQQLMKGKGKRSQRAQQSDDEGQQGQQGQQQSRQGGAQDQIKGLMNGDTSGIQGLMGSMGR
jgi:hypothetical protein